jgi:DUF4097 and DUF4098 domain-containing protein YvlB
MSSVPPNMPPGGVPPYPGYDAKTQWRVYKEQQKAAWRAQRDALRAQAQRDAWKAGYSGVYVPRVPSIVGPLVQIAIGVVALLVMTGHIAFSQFWSWYGHWWPLLLIGTGLALLGEWALDLRRPTPVHRAGGFVGLLILFAFLGMGAAGWNNWWGPMRAHFGDQDDEFFNSFGQPERDFDRQALFTQIPANAAIEIQNPRGDVSVVGDNVSTVEVQAHEVAYTGSDDDAKRVFDSMAPHLTVSGSTVLVKADSNNSGRLNLTITVPKSARVTINTGKGDITASGLGAGIHFNARGDVHLSSIVGSVEAHFTGGKHDFSAHDVLGDISTDGECNDMTLSEIKGKIAQNGAIWGDVHIETASGAVHLHTENTDLQIAQLPGDLTLDADDLRVSEAKGPVHVVTKSKDIDLSQIYGDSYVEDRDGRIAVEPAGSYGVDAKNGKGDVEVTLPPNDAASVEAHSRNGDIVSDFTMPSAGDGENKAVTFRIGAGGPKIALSADNGDVRIKRGTGFPAGPAAPTAPKAPTPPNAPHLKASKTTLPQPVAQ